jgi:hypothetical protein
MRHHRDGYFSGALIMAGYRQIHTQIWKDEWFIELSSDEKLLFIYLFSNEQTSISGVYKLPPRVIAYETGLDQGFVETALAKFDQQKKVYYRDGVIWVVNMPRYHANRSETTWKKILKDVRRLPDCWIKDQFLAQTDTPSMPHPYPIDTHNASDKTADTPYDVFVKEESESESEVKEEVVDDANRFAPLVKAVTDYAGLRELQGGPDRWFKSLSEMFDAGVIPEDVKTAVKELKRKNYSIVGINSIVNPSILVANRRRSGPDGEIGKISLDDLRSAGYEVR